MTPEEIAELERLWKLRGEHQGYYNRYSCFMSKAVPALLRAAKIAARVEKQGNTCFNCVHGDREKCPDCDSENGWEAME